MLGWFISNRKMSDRSILGKNVAVHFHSIEVFMRGILVLTRRLGVVMALGGIIYYTNVMSRTGKKV